MKQFDYNKYINSNPLLKEGISEESAHLGNTSNVHPWILTAMQELKDDLDFYLGPKNQYAGSSIDFDLIKKKMNNLNRLINKYQ